MRHSPRHPHQSPVRDRPALRGLLAVVLALGFASATLLEGAGAGAATDNLRRAESALAEAQEVRSRAEARLAGLNSEREQVLAEQRRLDEGAARITADLAEARREVREFAVAAYIDGGQSEMLASMLEPGSRAELAWRSQLIAGQTVDSADAVERYSALQEANDPERVAAATRLDRLESTIEQASDDVVLATARELEAQRAVQDARDAEQAAAEAAAAAEAESREAESAKAAARAIAVTSAPAPAPQPEQRTAEPPSSPTPAPSSPDGATEAESALLAKIRHCESRGNYQAVSASGRYRGAYQFDRGTWAAMGGSGDPAAASPEEQDRRALLLLRRRGTSPWPNCA